MVGRDVKDRGIRNAELEVQGPIVVRPESMVRNSAVQTFTVPDWETPAPIDHRPVNFVSRLRRMIIAGPAGMSLVVAVMAVRRTIRGASNRALKQCSK